MSQPCRPRWRNPRGVRYVARCSRPSIGISTTRTPARTASIVIAVSTPMTIDAVRKGLRVVEIPIDGLEHRPTYRTLVGFLHRGWQGWDIAKAVLPRMLR